MTTSHKHTASGTHCIWNSGLWTLDSGLWSIASGTHYIWNTLHLELSGLWTLGSGLWSIASGTHCIWNTLHLELWTLDSGLWTLEHCIWNTLHLEHTASGTLWTLDSASCEMVGPDNSSGYLSQCMGRPDDVLSKTSS